METLCSDHTKLLKNLSSKLKKLKEAIIDYLLLEYKAGLVNMNDYDTLLSIKDNLNFLACNHHLENIETKGGYIGQFGPRVFVIIELKYRMKVLNKRENKRISSIFC